MKPFVLAALLTASALPVVAQTIDFEKYNPPATLVVPKHPLQRAKFPFIDVHNHQWNMGEADLQQLVSVMNQLNMQVMVNLSGGNGDALKKKTDAIRATQPGRFIVFANIDFTGIGNANWTEKAVAQLKADVANGANGLKIFKNLGFSVKDTDGKRVTVDDPRLNAIWQTCGQLGIPVLIHTADPASFWQPMNDNNERLLELKTHPNRKRSDDNPAPWQTLIDEQHRMFAQHPKTTFIAAHFGWYPNNLAKLDSILTRLPNVVVEFGAVIAELGRQPRMAKTFLRNTKTAFCLAKTVGYPMNMLPISGCWKQPMNIFPTTKSTTLFGPCMAWA